MIINETIPAEIAVVFVNEETISKLCHDYLESKCILSLCTLKLHFILLKTSCFGEFYVEESSNDNNLKRSV